MRISEAAVLAAVAHPLRRRLLDALRVHGPLTVGLLSERTGSAVGNVSHHVRVLAEAGLLVEAPELARDRRERWWRLVSRGLTWTDADFDDDPATAAVASAATELGLQRQLSLTRAWLERAPDEPAWRRAAVSTDAWLSLSPQELDQLGHELGALFDRWRERTQASDGPGREPVFVFARGFPAQP
jgi:DNA-binding transcriptional ArsR family regulator